MEEVIIRAKRKGTENSFREVEKVQLEGIDILYSVDALEFEDNLPTNLKTNDPEEEKHWQEVREKAAIAAMQGTITLLSGDFQTFKYVVEDGFTGKQRTLPNEIAEFAVACADALVKQLKGQ